MRRVCFAALVIAIAGDALAQTESVYVNASRTITLAPEEVTFHLSVVTEPGASIEQVTAMVAPAGVTSNDLLQATGVQELVGPPPAAPLSRVTYAFAMTHPYSKLRETAEKLQAAQRNAVARGSDVQFRLHVTASQKSFDEARRQAWPELVTELRQKAEFAAAEANMTLGPLLSVGEGQAAGGQGQSVIPFAKFMPGSPVPEPVRITMQVYARFAAQAR